MIVLDKQRHGYKNCKICFKPFKVYISNISRKYCSRNCYTKSLIGKPTWNKDKKTGELNCKCKVCNKEFHLKPFAIKRGRGVYCSKKCFHFDRKTFMLGEGNHQYDKHWGAGEGNPNWRGGLSFIRYPLGWNKTFKEQIRNRDGYKCKICGKPEIENNKRLDIHHINYDKKDLNIDNLISLCMSCHRKTNFNRDYWIRFFAQGGVPYAQH